ncbi:WD40 repeat domain-containing protein [Streptomyces collinus]|uniref:WD40 repeat domain-containing protein n=1 Tax=Streptomyces collinus TaxID=42684 RepID=UPI0033B9206C
MSITAANGDAAGRDIHKPVIVTVHQYAEHRARIIDPSIRPYPGMAPFQYASQAAFFHGRAKETAKALKLLVSTSVSALVGSSGLGKSSLLACGLPHALAEDGIPGSRRWRVTYVKPSPLPAGEQLHEALHRAYHDLDAQSCLPEPAELHAEPALFGQWSARLAELSGERVVWLLDQFEACLASDVPAAERDRLVAAVLSTADLPPGSVHLMLAIRSDLYHRLECSMPLAGLVSTHQIWLKPLVEDALRDAVRLPAAKAGAEVEPQLVERIVQDAGGRPGSLPLIAYVLQRLWDARDASGRLTLAAYQDLGGISVALEERADAVWNGLEGPEEQSTARRTLVRLAHVGYGQRPTKRVVRASELVTEADSEQAVLDAIRPFVEDRLLLISRPQPGAEPTVEVAHDALLEAWTRLATWLQDRGTAKQLQDEVAGQTRRWLERGRSEAFLISGGQLDLLDGLLLEQWWSPNEPERQFITASRKALEGVRRTRRRARMMRRGLTVAASALALTVLFSAFMAVQRMRIAAEKTAEDALKLSAQARSAMDERRDVAAALALAAVQTDDMTATRAALVDTLAEPGGQLADRVARCGTDATANALASSLTKNQAAVLGCSDGSVRLVDPVTGREQDRLTGHHADAVSAVTLTSTGEVISGDIRGGLMLQNANRATVIRLHTRTLSRITAVAMDDRTHTLLATDDTGTVSRWQLRSRPPEVLKPLKLPQRVTALSVRRPDRFGVAATSTGHVVQFPLASAFHPKPTLIDTEMHAPPGTGVVLAARPDGQLAAADGITLNVWTGPPTRPPLTTAAPHTTAIVADPTVHAFYTGDESGHVRAWSTDGDPVVKGPALTGPPSDPVYALATDGQLIVALTQARRLVAWDLTGHRSPAVAAHRVPGAPVTALAHSPGGRLAYGTASGELRIASGPRLTLGSAAVRGIAWITRRELLAATADGVLHRVDATDGTRSVAAVHRSAPLVDIRAAPDGTAVAAWRDGMVLLHTRDGDTRRLRGVHGGAVTAVAVGPGTQVAVGTGDRMNTRVLLWRAGAITAEPHLLTGHHLYVAALAFSPDGRTLASGSDDRTIGLWDAASGRRRAWLRGHDDTVRALAWASNDLLASGAEDGTVRLWDPAADSNPIGHPLRYADGDVRALSASPGGRSLTAANDDSLATWPFNMSAWSALACSFSDNALSTDNANEYSPRNHARVPCPR